MHILPLFFYIVQVDGWRSEIDQRPFTLKVDRTSNLPQPQVLSNHSHNSHDAIRSAPYPVDLGRPFGKGRSDPLYDTTNSQASTSLFPNSAVLTRFLVRISLILISVKLVALICQHAFAHHL